MKINNLMEKNVVFSTCPTDNCCRTSCLSELSITCLGQTDKRYFERCTANARIKRYRIAFCDALFMVCYATSIMHRKVCDAKTVQPPKVKLVNGAVPARSSSFSTSLSVSNLHHCPFRDYAILLVSKRTIWYGRS